MRHVHTETFRFDSIELFKAMLQNQCGRSSVIDENNSLRSDELF